MIIYPAIDLLGGQCVRLRQGDYSQVTVYNKDPIAQAMQFKKAGAEWIHVVDLDAAKSGIPTNLEIIREISCQTGLKIQTGGGIRTMRHLEQLLDEGGITRAVLGTAAVKNRTLTEEILKYYPDRVAIGIDARDGEVSVDGWTQGSGLPALEFAKTMESLGARVVIFTDIARDGMMVGTATDRVRELVLETTLAVIASGGIGRYADIEAVRVTGAAGVIVGKAIYEGTVTLAQCWPNV
ncbi:MAG: 1-(5-phosphoribosyl)-5-[(5-phosphoribosylamino)methylideneamino]imidazole-4-carboxamide isomerase [Eubacteriales bacterium]|nr:1-(5-phosphoribosyl)-5-[(5-phosphoribosylamino)methylideneamino]imidazole-4-carboxamide isomerase [Eubacteriales bacterium]